MDVDPEVIQMSESPSIINAADAISSDKADIVPASSPSPTIPNISGCSTPTNILSRASPNNQSEDGPMLYDPNLPRGWTRRVTQRTMGASAGKYDVYIFSPDRKKIRSKTDLIVYLARNNLDLDPNQFDFSVRGRHNMPAKKPSSQKNKSVKLKSQLDSKENIGNGGMKLVLNTGMQTNNPGNNSVAAPGGNSNAGNTNGNLSNKPKLVVKFSFPVPRLKRSASMKSKKKRKVIVRQKSHSSQSDSATDVDIMEVEPDTEGEPSIEALGNNTANIKVSEDDEDTANLAYCDNISESDLFI